MANYDSMLVEIEKMSVAELNEFVRAIEEKFGVSAAAMAVAAPAGVAAGGEEEKSTFDVILKEVGGQKVQVIKVIKDALGIGLVEAKAITDGVPKVVKEGMAKADAEELKKKLEVAGGVVELK